MRIHGRHRHTHSTIYHGAHSATYMLFLSVCPSLNPAECLVCASVHPHSSVLIQPPSPLSTLSLYASRPAYHIPTVSLPINAHRAALQWGWRVPQQQSTVQSLQTCMYVPAGRRGISGGGETREERESKGERAANVSSQADRTAVPHYQCTHSLSTTAWLLHVYVNVCAIN